MIDIIFKKCWELTPNEERQLKKEIEKTIFYLNEGKIEQGSEKSEQRHLGEHNEPNTLCYASQPKGCLSEQSER